MGGGLDAPLWQQFFTCFHALLHGDTAVSTSDGRPVIDHVAERDNCHPIVNDTCFCFETGYRNFWRAYAALDRDSKINFFRYSFISPRFYRAIICVRAYSSIRFSVQLGLVAI